LDLSRTPPPFFKQGPSALSRLAFFSALALLLMVADLRFRLAEPVRQAVAALIYPLQAAVLWPVDRALAVSRDLQALRDAQAERDAARALALAQASAAQQARALQLENERLRELLELRQRIAVPALAAEIAYESRDPFSRKFVLDKGLAQGIEPGMPVIDAYGVVGQVTRAFVASSEVRAITDRDMAIPVQNQRTGVRSVAYGDPAPGGGLELRFTAANADVQPGDLLATSGLDGIYPAGLQVARVARVERRGESPFAKIVCTPLSGLERGRHVLVLKTTAPQVAPPPPDPREQKARDARARGGPRAARDAASQPGGGSGVTDTTTGRGR
jgi:rod shape-determining protein MreC